MAMNPAANNYNPFSGFDPRTALGDMRSQIMDYAGNMGGQGNMPGAGTNPQNTSLGMFQNYLQSRQRPPGYPSGGGGQPMLGIGDTMMPNQNPLQALFGNLSPALGNGGSGPGGGTWGPNTASGIQSNPFIQAMQGGAGQIAPTIGGAMGGYQQSVQSGNPDPLSLMQGFSSAQGGGIGGGAGQFGLPVGQGAPGGNALDWLSGLGMPIPPFLSNIANNRPGGGADYNTSLQQLGGIGGLPSLQTLMGLSPSEQEFLAGFFETVLGIPFTDVVAAAAKPFSGLGQARGARTSFR